MQSGHWVGVAAWANLLAGLSLTVSYVLVLASRTSDNPSGRAEIVGPAVVAGGLLYWIGGVANALVVMKHGVQTGHIGAFGHLVFAKGGALLALSGFGRPELIYSVADLWGSLLTSASNPSFGTFSNASGHIGILFMMVVSAIEFSYSLNSRAKGVFTPFSGVAFLFTGIWLMGVFGYWLPTLANSNDYAALVKLYGEGQSRPGNVHLAAPSFAWAWRIYPALAGAVLQAVAAFVLGCVDRGFAFAEHPRDELARALLEVDAYGAADPALRSLAGSLMKATSAVKDWKSQIRATTCVKNIKGDLYHEHQDLLKGVGVDKIVKEGVAGIGPDDVLLIVDMQNDFMPKEAAPLGGRFAVPEGELASVVIVDLIKLAADRGAHIIATRDYHPYNHCSFQEEGGPFPSHCVQGSEGSFLFPPILEALDRARKAGAKVDIVFKAFYAGADSFGGFPYSADYFQERTLGFTSGAQVPRAGLKCCTALGCSSIDFTGAHALLCSNLEADLNAPPDVLSVLDRRAVVDVISEPKRKRLLATGLALDFCVLDSTINASGEFAEVQLVADAGRAAHIPGVGAYGSGFLTDPKAIVDKMAKKGVALVYSDDLQAPGANWPDP